MAIIKAFADLIGNDKCVDESMRCRFPLGTDASGAISGCFGVEGFHQLEVERIAHIPKYVIALI